MFVENLHHNLNIKSQVILRWIRDAFAFSYYSLVGYPSLRRRLWNIIVVMSHTISKFTFSVLITRHMTKAVVWHDMKFRQFYNTLKRTQFDDEIMILLIVVALAEAIVWEARLQQCTYLWEYTVSQRSKLTGNDVYKISAIKVDLDALTTSHSSPLWVIYALHVQVTASYGSLCAPASVVSKGEWFSD